MLVAMLLGLVAAGPVRAVSVLHFLDSYGPLDTSATRSALNQLGLTATETTHGNFTADLTSQSWDLVIVDVPGSTIAAFDQTALANYIAGGGRSILSYWNLDTAPTLQAAYDVTVNADIFTTMTVYRWDTSHPVFNSPNSVADLTNFTDMANDDGDRMSLSGGTAIGGFTPSPTAGEAAIVIGNSGRTIANGFLFWNMKDGNGFIAPNNVNLVANEIGYLVGIPEPSTLALMAAGVAFLGGRRRLSA
jgi:hypothetical protein